VSRNRVIFPAIALAACSPAHNSKYIEPHNFLQSQTYPDAPDWLEATLDEMTSFVKMGVLLPLNPEDIPAEANVVGTRFIYKLRRTSDGGIEKYKARLIAQGFTQEYGVDYTDTFAPVSQVLSVRTVLILALQLGLKTHHVDVKCAFLNSTLKEEVYVKLPKGFEVGGKGFARALKSIYGLKQAAHDWSVLQDDFIRNYDPRMKQSDSEPCIYYIVDGDLTVLINTHVDDYTICCNDQDWYDRFMQAFGQAFECRDLGEVSHLLQTKVTWADDYSSVSLSQERYIKELAVKYGVTDCKPVNSPMEHGLNLDPEPDPDSFAKLPFRSLVGQLLWLSRVTRPDITFAVAYMARFTNCAGQTHFTHLLRILKYLVTTQDVCLTYHKHSPDEAPLRVYSYSDADRFPDQPLLTGAPLEAYSDSDWAGDHIDRRSVSGSIVYLFGNPVVWNSQRQTTVALSTAEAEYYALAEASKEAIHIRQLVGQIFPSVEEVATPVHIDNKGAGHMAENMVNNKRTKHIDIRYHFVRHYIRDKKVELFHVPTHLNVSDILTKALPVQTFRKLSKMILDCG
jgi:hypothetical protein